MLPQTSFIRLCVSGAVLVINSHFPPLRNNLSARQDSALRVRQLVAELSSRATDPKHLPVLFLADLNCPRHEIHQQLGPLWPGYLDTRQAGVAFRGFSDAWVEAGCTPGSRGQYVATWSDMNESPCYNPQLCFVCQIGGDNEVITRILRPGRGKENHLDFILFTGLVRKDNIDERVNSLQM